MVAGAWNHPLTKLTFNHLASAGNDVGRDENNSVIALQKCEQVRCKYAPFMVLYRAIVVQ